MDAQSITEEFIRLVQSNPQKYYRDFLKIDQEAKKENALYKDKPIPFLYQPMFFTPEDIDAFHQIGAMLYTIAEKVTQAFLTMPSFRQKFHYPDFLEELILVDPGYEVSIPISRYDLFYHSKDRFQFIEVNTDGTSGMNEDNIFSRLLLDSLALQELQKDYRIDYFELMEKWVDESLQTYQSFKWKRTDRPNIAIVDFMEAGITAEFEEIQKIYVKRGYHAFLAEARELDYKDGVLTYKGTPIHMIYRRIVTGDLVRNIKEVTPLIEAYKDGAVCMIGSFRTQLMHNKMIFKILHDEDSLSIFTKEEKNFIQNHVPFTRSFKEDPVAYEKVLHHKDDYILKPVDSYASQGVNTGRDYDFAQWKAIVDDCYGKDFLYQPFIDPPTRKFVCFDENGQVDVIDFKLNVGVTNYNEKFAGLYTRISTHNIIFGQSTYYSIPNMLVQAKEHKS